MLKRYSRIWAVLTLALGLGLPWQALAEKDKREPETIASEEGPHGGKLLRGDALSIEIGIFEDGVPPEFRVWAYTDDEQLQPDAVNVTVALERLGGVRDQIVFSRKGDYLRGDTSIYEPHSFIVQLEADYQGKRYQWRYENFEGRTTINEELARANGIQTRAISPETILSKVGVFGRLTSDRASYRDVSARFPGMVEAVHVRLGQKVEEGERLISLQSNQGLGVYPVKAPIAGVVTSLDIAEGEVTGDKVLARISSANELLAEFLVFPGDVIAVREGNGVRVCVDALDACFNGNVNYVSRWMGEGNAYMTRASMDTTDSRLREGMFVTGEIITSQTDVPMAVPHRAIQRFRDFDVVYAQVDDTYEVRMIEIGRQGVNNVEVTGGIEPGMRYVVDNSYVIKADIEKSGASHDH
tara:strand:+ start:5470 stop:6705 length:1236 start_codon:yes stop_codon:yes gene_type:complete